MSSKVLIEVSPDGFIRVFADEGVSAFIINLPAMEQSNAAQILSEEWAELNMPRSYRELYGDARRLVKVGNAACPTVVDLARSEARVQVLSASHRSY
jgi:hypothetical protein